MISSSVLQAYTGSTDTTALAQIEAGVVGWLERWIPRHLGVSATLTEIHSGPSRRHAQISGRFEGNRLSTIYLSEEIAEGSLVSVKERTSPTASWVDIPNPADLTDYEIRTSAPAKTTGNELVRLSTTFPGGNDNLQIAYTHGYAEDAAPDDVTLLVLQAVKGMITAQETGPFSSASADGTSYTMASVENLPGVDRRLLASLRRPSW